MTVEIGGYSWVFTKSMEKRNAESTLIFVLPHLFLSNLAISTHNGWPQAYQWYYAPRDPPLCCKVQPVPNKDDKLPDIYGHLQYCYKPLHSGHHWGMKFCPLGPGASAFGTQQSGWCPSGALLYSPSNDTRQRHKFHCCESPHYKHSISHSGVGMGGGGLRGLEPPLFLMEPPPPHILWSPKIS